MWCLPIVFKNISKNMWCLPTVSECVKLQIIWINIIISLFNIHLSHEKIYHIRLKVTNKSYLYKMLIHTSSCGRQHILLYFVDLIDTKL